MLELPEWILGGTSTVSRSTSASHLAQHYVNRSLLVDFPRKPSPPSSAHGSTQGMNTGPSTADLLRGGPSSKSMRFMNTFLDVLRLFASHKVICLCIDDLHFADEESLELLSNIMSSKIKIVLIVTYRPEQFMERDAAPLLQNELANFTRIELSSLSEDDIVEFVHATLYREREYILPLAAVVEEKSDGNPFYMREMLDACHRSKCLWYCWKDSRWEYDLDRVFSLFESDTGNYGQRLNHDFIIKRLQELPEAAKSIIAWASLLGNKFSFTLVQQLMISEFAYKDDEGPNVTPSGQPSSQSPGANDAVGGLQAALQAYVLVPSEDDDEQFRFAHDRYIAAAASLTARRNIEKSHFLIAQTMMKYPDNRSLYTRSSHICHAIELIKKRIKYRSSYRDLLCRAAEQASESGARSTALYYYTSCMALLQPNPWDDDLPDVFYEETLQLYTRSAECYWYQGNSAEALKILEITTSKAKSPEDKSPSWVLQSRILAQGGDPFAAFKALKAGLIQLGQEMETTSWESCDHTYRQLCQQFERIDRQELIDREADDDRNLIATGALLVEIVSAAFWSDALLFYQMALKEISLHLHRGTYTQVGLGYAHFAIIATSRFQELPLAVEVADISKYLMHKFRNAYTMGRGCVVHSLFLSHIQGHIRDDLPTLEAAMDYTLSAGDRGLTLLSLGSIALCKLYSSDDLAEVEAFCTYAPEELNNWSTDLRGGTILIAVRQVARALQGKTYWRFAGEVLADEDHSSMQYIEYILAKTASPERTLDIYNSLALVPLFLYGHIDKTVDVGTRCINSIQLSSMRTERLLLFYLSLALVAQLRNKPLSIDKQKTLDRVQGYKTKIEEWQKVNDVNYAMWSLLVHAELCELTYDYSEAIQAYETALDHSQQHGFVLEEALCFGQQADFFLRRGARRAARIMILESINAYARFNATGIVKYLTHKYSAILEAPTSNRNVDIGCQTTEIVRDTRNTPYRLGEHQRQTEHKLGSETSEDRTRAWLAPNMGNDASKKPDTSLSGLGLDMIDLTSILESSQVISSELQLDRLLTKMLDVILDSTGGQADYAAVIVDEDDSWMVAASGDAESGVTPYIPGLPLSDVDEISKPLALYALRFKETVFLHNLLDDERFANVTASYSLKNPGGKSVIALPIVHGQDSLLANAQLFKRIQKVSASNLSMIDSQKRALAQAREAEKKAKVAEAEALRNVRLKEEAAKAKSMFLANVSHELRTPLNGVIGMSELLKGTTMTKDQNEYADSIRLCADTLLTVINDILDFSKLEAGKMKISSVPLNLHETITEVVRALAFTNRDRQLDTIEKLDLDRSLLVMGDPVRLRQILMNLLSNSYKFTSKGSVTIRATTDLETSDSIRVTCSVADTGIGITQAQLKKLFLPFSQADSSTQRSYGGSGLGLSICKAIIENVLLGKIWLKSKPGVGTTVYFTLTFPKASKDATATMSQVTAKDPDPMAIYSPPAETASLTSFIDLSRIPRDQFRICIAEDNPINQKIAISFVTKLGFQCDAYNDGMQAVEALRQRSKESKPYHLVLMDVQMPVLDGYDATRLIRKDKDPAVRNVLVIAMTASAIRGDREKCLEAGMNDYLAKPVRAQVLKSKLEEYLNQPTQPIVNLQHKADDIARSVLDNMRPPPGPPKAAPKSSYDGGGEFVLEDLPQRTRPDQDNQSHPRSSGEELRERAITPTEPRTQINGNAASNGLDPSSL
ncbi:MAG: hypothetical protein M1836_005910 [Candelina mexicana]|nr:MAG: hypothetical protein M1836_005910 [Candelina mexicana]